MGEYWLDDAGFGTAMAAASDVPSSSWTAGGLTFWISRIQRPPAVVRYNTDSWLDRLRASPRLAYVRDAEEGRLIQDLSDPANPQLLDRLARVPEGDTYGYGSVSFSEGYACVIDTSGLRVLDLRDPDHPRLIASQSSVSPGRQRRFRVAPSTSRWRTVRPTGSRATPTVLPIHYAIGAQMHLDWKVGAGRTWKERPVFPIPTGKTSGFRKRQAAPRCRPPAPRLLPASPALSRISTARVPRRIGNAGCNLCPDFFGKELKAVHATRPSSETNKHIRSKS